MTEELALQQRVGQRRAVDRDEGPGGAPGEEERIFEPFHTRKLRGTGLGLPIARRAVEQQGGSIAARNLPGGGACFRITIARA